MNTTFNPETRRELEDNGIKTPKLNLVLSKLYWKLNNFGYGKVQVQLLEIKSYCKRAIKAIDKYESDKKGRLNE